LKNYLTYDVISNADAFFIFWTRIFLSVSISPKVSILLKCPISPKFSCKKHSAVLPLPIPYNTNLTGHKRSNIGRRPLSKITANRKTLNFHWPKNQSASTSYGFARTGFLENLTEKSIFFRKLFLKWPEKILYTIA
jgi:hypothetical protein